MPKRPSDPIRLDRYEILDRLGEGGMGLLYLARDPLLQRRVAIKVLSSENDELRQRFTREARAVAALRHNNIVTIFDVGEDAGRAFIAMEFIDGNTLGELIRRPVLAVGRKIDIMVDVCAGLDYAHRNGVVHRDVKPANVMVDTDGQVKILDFGVARIMSEGTFGDLTQTGALLGTPHYMSPEQIRGEAIDARSDVFAVGLVLYEFLSGQKGYDGGSPFSILNKILTGEPPSLKAVCPDMDPHLALIVQRATQREIAERYASLAEMRVDLVAARERINADARSPTVLLPRPAVLELTTPATRDVAPRAHDIDASSRQRSAEVSRHLTDALTHLNRGDYDEAIESAELGLAHDETNVSLRDVLRQAESASQARKLEEALGAVRDHLSRGDLDGASALIQHCLRLAPESAEVLALHQHLLAAAADRELHRSRRLRVESALASARTSLAEGDPATALLAAESALELDPTSDEAGSIRGVALRALEPKPLQDDRTPLKLPADAPEVAAEHAEEHPKAPPVRLAPPPDESPEAVLETRALGQRWRNVAVTAAVVFASAMFGTLWSRSNRPAEMSGAVAGALPASGSSPSRTEVPSEATPESGAPATADRTDTPMTVQINAIPWATVRIMSKSRNGEVHEGVTPLALELSHGEYTVEFQNKLYRPVSRSFTVAPNGLTVLTVTMPTADVDQMVADILGPAS